MDTAKITDDYSRLKQPGDSIRITRMVNTIRARKGKDRMISCSYVNLMLNGNRKMTKEVAEIADKYLKKQEEITKNLTT